LEWFVFKKKDTDRYLYYIKIYDIGKVSAVKFDIMLD